MRLRIVPAALILFLLAQTACLPEGWLKSKSNASGNILASDDQMIELTLPDGWTQNKGLHEGANLQAGNMKDDVYVVVLSENKADFENMDLQKHSDTTRNILVGNLQSSTVSEPTKFKIGELDALQYEVGGTFANINLVYLHTTIETPTHFHQILTWTTKSRFDANKETFQKMIRSFKMRAVTPPESAPKAQQAQESDAAKPSEPAAAPTEK